MKSATRDQSNEVTARTATTTRWGELDPELLQEQVINLPPAEFGRRMTAFLKSGMRLSVRGKSVITIDRSKPFKHRVFDSLFWHSVWEDVRASAFTQVDFVEVHFESFCEKDRHIPCTERVKRMKADPRVLLDAEVGQALYEEESQATLRFLYDAYGLSEFLLGGTIKSDSEDEGHESVVRLYRRTNDGCWVLTSQRLDVLDSTQVFAVLPPHKAKSCESSKSG